MPVESYPSERSKPCVALCFPFVVWCAAPWHTLACRVPVGQLFLERLVMCTGFGKRGAYHVEASCCIYGTLRRMALTFLATNRAHDTIFLSCDPFKGICKRTGQRLWHLHGRDVHGSLWTDRADPWPHALQIAVSRSLRHYTLV